MTCLNLKWKELLNLIRLELTCIINYLKINKNMIEIEGFHGTSFAAANEIIKSNYESSKGDKEWLGDGVYFFLKGINENPRDQAKKWAIAQSWDKKTGKNKYKRFCVIKSNIKVDEDNFLDLTNSEGVEVLEYLVKTFEDKLKKINRKLEFIDGLVINLARNEGILEIDVVRGNFYIKFAEERIKRINLRTNNCTICSVNNPIKNIVASTILEIGEIE